MRVTSLDGALLDFWVAKSENLQLLPQFPENEQTRLNESGYWHPSTYHPSSDWSQAGPIISNEWYSIEDALIEWFGPTWPSIRAISTAPLKWLMRAYVKTKFGDEVEEVEEAEYAPPELLTNKAYRINSNAKRWPSWLSGN